MYVSFNHCVSIGLGSMELRVSRKITYFVIFHKNTVSSRKRTHTIRSSKEVRGTPVVPKKSSTTYEGEMLLGVVKFPRVYRTSFLWINRNKLGCKRFETLSRNLLRPDPERKTPTPFPHPIPPLSTEEKKFFTEYPTNQKERKLY